MFTTIDKALVAVIMGGAALANMLFGINFGLDEGMVAKIAAVLTPILVWLVPNRA